MKNLSIVIALILPSLVMANDKAKGRGAWSYALACASIEKAAPLPAVPSKTCSCSSQCSCGCNAGKSCSCGNTVTGLTSQNSVRAALPQVQSSEVCVGGR